MERPRIDLKKLLRLPGLRQQKQKKSKPLNSNGLAVFAFRAYPFCSLNVNCVVSDSGV
jgi:hypothetical protein